MIQMPDSSYDALFLIKTHYIMRVVEFHPEAQTVDLIQDVYEFTNIPAGDMTIVNEFGNEVVVGLKEPTVLRAVPVKQLRWGQFEIQCCPKEGDTGYIEVMTNDIRDWIQHGSSSIPWTDKHFIKESCVFVPFVPNFENRSQDYPETNDTLVIKSANAKVVITDKQELGEEPVVDISTTSSTLHVTADGGVFCSGDLSVDGNLSVDGTITASGDIESTSGEITANDFVANGIRFSTHVHESAAPGTPTSGPMAPSA